MARSLQRFLETAPVKYQELWDFLTLTVFLLYQSTKQREQLLPACSLYNVYEMVNKDGFSYSSLSHQISYAWCGNSEAQNSLR